jgi:TatA/E family protein of Tat protein translocase
MPFNIGPGELIIVLIIALIVVGPGKLPEVGSSLGKSIREFRKAATDVKDTASLDPAPAAASSSGASSTPPTPGIAAAAPAAALAAPSLSPAEPVGAAVAVEDAAPPALESAAAPADESLTPGA